MPFLENLILGKPGSERRRRYAEDTSLTGGGGSDTWLGGFGAFSLLRSRRNEVAAPVEEELAPGERRVCGSLVCGNVWTAPWRSRERPIFEGEWACSSRCLSAMIRAALARETGEGVYDDGPEPHHHRIPLGLVMLAQGWITHPQLQKALEAQRRHGTGRIGEWLVAECGMKPERIARGLSVQWNCPVLSMESFWPEAMALALPRVFLEEYGIVPLRVAGRKILYIGFQDGLDASASFALEQMTGLRTESGLLPEAEFRDARETLLRCEFPHHTISAVSDRDGLARAIVETVEHESPAASRLVRLHHYYWLRVWAKRQTSRPGGDLPETAECVKDYMFSIGSRMPRWVHEDNLQQDRIPQDRIQQDRAELPFAERERYQASEEPVVRAVADRDEAVAEQAAENTASEEAVSYSAATGAGVEESASAEPEEAPAVTGHFLAKLASPKERMIETFVDGAEGTALKADAASLQKNPLSSAEAIDGEYLTTDLVLVDFSVMVSEASLASWNWLGRRLRLKPSFPTRESGPASGQDRGV